MSLKVGQYHNLFLCGIVENHTLFCACTLLEYATKYAYKFFHIENCFNKVCHCDLEYKRQTS